MTSEPLPSAAALEGLARGGWAAEAECLRGLAMARETDAAAVDGFLLELAELLAARRRPAEAAQRFLELHRRTASSASHSSSHSSSSSSSLNVSSASAPLRRAAVCALIADAGAARARLLCAIDREEREAQCLGGLAALVARASRAHVLRREDMQCLMPFVEPPVDAAAVGAAFAQHNLLALARVYDNIGCAQLGGVLDIAPDEAERLVARMVSERRLHARIDQTTGTVLFAAPGRGAPLSAWDERIAAVCKEVSRAADRIVSQHAEYNEYLLLQ